MTTEIEYCTNGILTVQSLDGHFVCSVSEYNRHHEGIWNSRVLAFVPQQQPADTFSDGTPVASYEQFNVEEM